METPKHLKKLTFATLTHEQMEKLSAKYPEWMAKNRPEACKEMVERAIGCFGVNGIADWVAKLMNLSGAK